MKTVRILVAIVVALIGVFGPGVRAVIGQHSSVAAGTQAITANIPIVRTGLKGSLHMMTWDGSEGTSVPTDPVAYVTLLRVNEETGEKFLDLTGTKKLEVCRTGSSVDCLRAVPNDISMFTYFVSRESFPAGTEVGSELDVRGEAEAFYHPSGENNQVRVVVEDGNQRASLIEMYETGVVVDVPQMLWLDEEKTELVVGLWIWSQWNGMPVQPDFMFSATGLTTLKVELGMFSIPTVIDYGWNWVSQGFSVVRDSSRITAPSLCVGIQVQEPEYAEGWVDGPVKRGCTGTR